MSTLKFHKIKIDSATPQEFMVWAASEPSARKLWCETFLRCEPATQLEIVAHGKADLPVIGLPSEESQS